MDDDRRRLDRDAAAGDPDARARLLVARLRAGELTRERLALAAMFGDRAAREALAPEAPPQEVGSAMGAALALKPYGPPAFARAALALARWLDEPQLGWLRAVKRWVDAADPSAELSSGVPGWDPTQVGSVVHLARRLTRELRRDDPGPGAEARADGAVRLAFAEHLVPWACGEGDPARERDLPPPVRRFSPRERFEEGERLRHEHWGLGQVIRLDGSWIVVRFADEERKLKLKPPS